MIKPIPKTYAYSGRTSGPAGQDGPSPCSRKATQINSASKTGRALWLLLTTILLLSACSKQQLEDYGSSLTPFSDYLPTSAGDISYYSLDSIVAAPFGVRMDTVHYFAKDSVGNPSITAQDTTYPIYRYLAPVSAPDGWSYQLTYRLVFTSHTAALIDPHNRRFIILTDPVRQDYSWEGNRYFSSDLNPGDFYYGWAYTYDLSAVAGELTVHQIDQTNGNPGAFDPSLYQEKLFAELHFKRGVGLISQRTTHVTYQANQNNPGSFGYYEQDSYGVRLNRLDEQEQPN